MNKKTLKSVLAIAILITTISVFTVYFVRHPEIFRSLESISVTTLAVLLLLYCLFMGALAWVQAATIQLSGIIVGKKENILLVSYSSIINFFGPLQSGPAFRAAYLKKKYNVSLKRYTVATLLYYGLYAAFSGIFLLTFILGYYSALAVILIFLLIPFARSIPKFSNFDVKDIRSLAFATLSQVLILAVIYHFALISLAPQVSYLQSLTYTGAANFALFVSITPGAIGFRETFLFLSQQLHGISTEIIATASVIDRSIYIVLLLILSVFIFGLHANDHLKTTNKS